jgi:tRNA uridine 5-carboxymethylaminomethyl modification enzyme
MKTKRFDCIVIGAGHAGAEAAHACARLGAETALVTLSRATVGQMSCNPAIGGLAKGQIVREVDALGGLMGRAIDATGIQFRILNRSKGPAVQSPRAQADKYRYAGWVLATLEQTPGLTLLPAMVDAITVADGRVTGIRTSDGTRIDSPAVVVATGTFMKGLMHLGEEQQPGGRLHEPASQRLSDCLRELGLTVARLKTGTPPRLDARTVDLDGLEVQHGDAVPQPFSFMNDRIGQTQIPCWITYTNEKIHGLLRENLDRAPMFSGQIQSTGPRYCPSIESKIVRFADKTQHQVYLEPEDREVTTLYCNGISTSVPRDIQAQMIRLLPGTERARIVHYAYAIEYDYCPARQLKRSLETKSVQGLFLAGQINGTSGYEEAAGQGLLAGLNAVRQLRGQPPVVLPRSQAYLGVLVDDLLTRDIDEPYRMFTSRAEYRLSLRSDNADRRLTPLGHELGLVEEERWQRHRRRQQQLEALVRYLRETRREDRRLWDILRQPNNTLADRLCQDGFVQENRLDPAVIEAAVIDAKYEGYLAKQERLAASLQTLDRVPLPVDLNYFGIEHLRHEAREKLTAFRPETLGQASRIGGITPADVTVLQVTLRKMRGEAARQAPQ